MRRDVSIVFNLRNSIDACNLTPPDPKASHTAPTPLARFSDLQRSYIIVTNIVNVELYAPYSQGYSLCILLIKCKAAKRQVVIAVAVVAPEW